MAIDVFPPEKKCKANAHAMSEEESKRKKAAHKREVRAQKAAEKAFGIGASEVKPPPQRGRKRSPGSVCITA